MRMLRYLSFQNVLIYGTFVFQNKSPAGLMFHVVQYSTQNKISMSMFLSMSMSMWTKAQQSACPEHRHKSNTVMQCPLTKYAQAAQL